MKALIATMIVGFATAAQRDRWELVKEIQNTPGVLWKAGINPRFAHEPVGVSKILAGVKPAAMASRAEYARKHTQKAKLPGVKPEAMAKRAEYAKTHNQQVATVALPESFDSEAKWPQCAKVIGDIRDQSMCGCCWAFAAASAASDRLCISTNGTTAVPLSAQDVCFCASDDGCNGGDIQGPWDYIRSQGAVTGGQYQGTGPFGKGLCQDFSLPHCHHHGPQGDDPYPAEGTKGCPQQSSPQCPTTCDAGAKSPHADFKKDKWSFAGDSGSASGEDAIAQAIMEGGPVETAFTVYDDFENYVSGIYHHVTGDEGGGHAVRIVGWGVEGGVKYWKIANSWNPHWGEKGYFRIKKGNNECGVEDQVTFSPAHAKWSPGAGHGPSPGPGCADSEDTPYCSYTKTNGLCKFNSKKCKKTCGCCDAHPPGYCFGESPSIVV